MQKTLNIGFIGCGSIANSKHFKAQKRLQDEGKVKMVAFCDLIVERAQKAAREYGWEGAAVYEDYRELLVREDIDVVHVLTENAGHAPISIAALRAGKHVMCEKPMAKTYAEACQMLKAAQESGKKLTIGYQTRFSKESLMAKQLCDAGELGEIYYARASYTRRRGAPIRGAFLSQEKQGGGPLIDIATHALDRTLWHMNNYEPDRVLGAAFTKLNNGTKANSYGPWDPEQYTVEDSAFAHVRMKNGAVIMIECSWLLNMDIPNANVLCGTKAGVDFFDGLNINYEKNGVLYKSKLEPTRHNVELAQGRDLWQKDLEAECFYRTIVDDTDPIVLPEQALVVSQILEGIYISSKTGKEYIF